MEDKDLKYLGYSNGWYFNLWGEPSGAPEIIRKCREMGHRLKEERTGRNKYRYTCEKCGYTYLEDSSD